MADPLDYESPPERDASRQKWIFRYAALLLVGVVFLIWSTQARLLSAWEWFLAPISLLFGLLPSPARRIKQFSDWLDALSPRGHAQLVGILCIVLPIWMMFSALIGHRALVPLMHDSRCTSCRPASWPPAIWRCRRCRWASSLTRSMSL
jgi:hypothetical protein